jgi:hypothetical protein
VNEKHNDGRIKTPAREKTIEGQVPNPSKDIKIEIDRYEAKIRSGEPPAGDSTRSEE